MKTFISHGVSSASSLSLVVDFFLPSVLPTLCEYTLSLLVNLETIYFSLIFLQVSLKSPREISLLAWVAQKVSDRICIRSITT